jgi:hypothetical protein
MKMSMMCLLPIDWEIIGCYHFSTAKAYLRWTDERNPIPDQSLHIDLCGDDSNVMGITGAWTPQIVLVPL